MIGVVIGGNPQRIKIRVKSGESIGIGDLLIVEDTLYKVTNVYLSSEHGEKDVEILAEDIIKERAKILEEDERFYKVAEAKQIGKIIEDKIIPRRDVPEFFSKVFKANGEILKQIVEKGDIKIGKLRFGSEVFNVDVYLPEIEKIISHHILISAATGKGKSNLAKVILKEIAEHNLRGGKISAIVFDPHKEYWGKGGIKGLKDVGGEVRKVLSYYTLNPREEEGDGELKVNPNLLEPSDFYGIIDLTSTQIQALEAIYKVYKSPEEEKAFLQMGGNVIKEKGWLRALIEDTDKVARCMEKFGFKNPSTFYILKRKISYALDLGWGCFTFDTEENFFEKIIEEIKKGKIVIIDTSAISDISERILASAIASRVFKFYRFLRQRNPKEWENLPTLMILFEEAPRFIGKAVLEKGRNIFERIAREGRKFKVGLCAITQMPSLIPREILSQMNTKIILGTPSSEDRRALIESSSQSIEDEDREIQIMDVGEAIITSPFIKFPYSVKIYKFEEIIEKEEEEEIENFGVG